MESVLSKSQKLIKLNNLIKNKQSLFKETQNQFIKIVEMGPRDGLQNEQKLVPTDEKVNFINKLNKCGFKAIETTSFVSPKWVPQMGDHSEVYKQIIKKTGVSYPVLVPNVKGLEKALEAGVKEIAVFGAASESFTKKNINCTIAESLDRFKDVIKIAQENNLKIRGYVSCVMGCPYEGDINPEKVLEVSEIMYKMGCYEISLGDTIGVGTPEKTQLLFDTLKKSDKIPIEHYAAHFHDTYDKAIENILVAVKEGVRIIDSSTGGLGGCPYAKKSAGNVCTENVVYTLHELGFKTDIDLNELKQVGDYITSYLERENMSVLE